MSDSESVSDSEPPVLFNAKDHQAIVKIKAVVKLLNLIKTSSKTRQIEIFAFSNDLRSPSGPGESKGSNWWLSWYDACLWTALWRTTIDSGRSLWPNILDRLKKIITCPFYTTSPLLKRNKHRHENLSPYPHTNIGVLKFRT